MASSASDYFHTIVRPTVNDALAHQVSRRHALMAAIALHHTIDHWAMAIYDGPDDRKPMADAVSALREEVFVACPAALIVGDIADAAKHSVLAKTRSGYRLVPSVDRVMTSMGAMGPLGTAPLNTGPHIFVVDQHGTKRMLHPLLNEVFDYWQSRVSDRESQ